jgi:iron complex transport system ATP-binding protein
MTNQPLLVARDLKVRLGATQVLGGVSVELHAGEVLGVVGPNGAGKSTLLRALAALIPFEGQIDILSRPIAVLSRNEVAREIALVPQDLPVDLPFTVAEIVLMGRAPHQGPWGLDSAADREIVREALDAVDLTAFASRPIDVLSGGERRRAFVARALAQRARVLLLDEPTAFLDIGHQLDLLGRCRALAAQGLAVAAVLHDPNLAASYCDRVIVLCAGTVRASGPPRVALTLEVLRDAFGASFLSIEHPKTRAPVFVPS